MRSWGAAPPRTVKAGTLDGTDPALGEFGRSEAGKVKGPCSTWNGSFPSEKRLERETGIEPATNSLGS